MRASISTLSLIVFVSLVAGCGTDIASKVTCGSSKDCLTAAGTLFAADASVYGLPVCCNDSGGGGMVCLLPINTDPTLANPNGCDSGFRYLTSEPSFGDCVPMFSGTNSCMVPTPPPPPPPDMSGTETD
jgi:hypothetical protein